MKRFLAFIYAVCFLLTACACTVTEPPATAQVPTSTSADTFTETIIPEQVDNIAAVSMPAVTHPYYADDGTTLFSHTYQNMFLVLPNPLIADKVITHYLESTDWIHDEAQKTYDQAIQNYTAGVDWYPYMCQLLYSPMRIDQDVLSLYGSQVIYSGEGRPSRNGVSLNFDLLTGDILTLGSIMHADATMEQFQLLVTEKLGDMAEKYYLFDDYADAVALRFSTDESQFEAFYFTQNGLCFYFDIYEIAPSSSGIISVEIPYSDLLGLIHDAYFPAERDTAAGCLYQKDFNDMNMNVFSSITEAVLSQSGNMIVFYTDSAVQDIRIESVSEDAAHTQYTLYAAYTLNEAEAIAVEGTQEQLSALCVSYFNKDGRHILDNPK